MRSTIRHLGVLGGFLVAGFALHSPAMAQEAQTLSAPTVTPAQRLEMKADQPVTHDNWLPVAADLEHAAKLRPADNLTALNDLMGAATLYQSVGRPTIALSIVSDVASRAEHAGDIDLAAHAYTGAITLALKLDDSDQASYYLGKLEALARRPGVTPAEKQAILGPLGLLGPTCK